MPKKLNDPSTPMTNPEAVNPRTLTADDLEILAAVDPQKAQLMMDLQKKLKDKRQEELDADGLRALQIRLLKQVEETIEATRRNQEMCSRARHMRENQTSALVGQRDNNGVLRLVCARCQKSYEGIGNSGKGLPMEIAQFLDMSTIGGVNA